MRLFVLILCCTYLLQAQESSPRPWLDYSKPVNERVQSMINSMTLEEKVSQMLNNSAAIPRLGIEGYDWWSEALHGVARSGKATVFPQAIGSAATFDPDLMMRIGTAISDEARAIHNELRKAGKPYIQYMGLTFWSPNVNLFRDPRWGRGQETYGEDPFLSGSMGAAFVKGMQGNDPTYLKTGACAKHFVVHSGPEGERHGFNALASKKDLYESYLPAFKACVDAGVEAVMCAYNRTNDAPCCGSTPLLKEILRDEWGFRGHLLSDCGAIGDIHSGHHYTRNATESAALALQNGVNLNCGNTYKYLVDAVKQGLVTEEMIDENLAPLLRTRFKLGLFDPPDKVPFSKIDPDVINSPAHRKLALEAASKSVVLLQNKNNVLPLDKNARFIYVSGPLAERTISLLGNYNGLSPRMTTILEGIVNEISPSTRIQFRSGGLLSTPNLNDQDWFSGLARKADATIAVVGLSVLLEGEEGEAIAGDSHGDNPTMQLPQSQMTLLRKLSNKEKPLIVVVCAGSPVDLSEVKELADAILYAWYPGEEGGQAVANILFGKTSPSGKLPITFPKSVDQLPPFNDYSMAGRTYRFMEKEPLYPFGYGLTYTAISIDDPQISGNTIFVKEKSIIQTTVTNTGEVASDEVIQLYVSLDDAAGNSPISELKAFRRIHLNPGEKKEVSFALNNHDFSFFNKDGVEEAYHGSAKVYIGNASPGQRSQALGAVIKSIEVTVE